jgi:hypothetical protein
MYTHIPSSLLDPYKEVLISLDQWNLSKQPKLWTENRIDGEMMYKIHRHSARIVEETGLSVQQIIYDNHNVSEKVFPFYYQILKINGNIENAKFDEDTFCQTLTYLNGEYENSTFVIKNGESYLNNFNNDTYAFAIIWKMHVNPITPKWFIRPYYRMFM